LFGAVDTFPEEDHSRSTNSILLDAIAFSPDGAFVAVGSASGGAWRIDQRFLMTWHAWGPLREGVPADPLRVFRISDGKLVSSLGSFPGGLWRGGLTWSPSGEYLAFIDFRGDIRFWSPFRPNLSAAVARGADHYANLRFSKDGSQLAANFPDGVRIFNLAASK
jgi:WD40 repeat protein